MNRKKEQEKNELQQKVYDFLVEYITKNGFPPSVREIRDGTNFKSTSSAYMHLLKLEDEGKIQMKRKTTRAIKVMGFEFVKMEE